MRSTRSGLAAAGFVFAGLGYLSRADEPVAAPAAIDFFKHVRPILAQHCFQCHGPDAAARKGDLRLDLKADSFAQRDDYFVVKPGDPGASELIRRIRAEDPRDLMPPKKTGDSLSPKQIEILEAWIAQGAPWAEHWSFSAPVRGEVPTVADPGWVRDPIDAFVLARIEAAGLRPESEASRESWLRRASFDLTGLPPTLEELDAFVRDASQDAHAKQVERLLASPRYGERQASEWLDLARYADTGGYQRDEARSNWKWRDWVVDAFNSNLPYDRFGIEQLAGDLLPSPTLAQRIATGFNRNHPTNSEAGEEEDEYRSAYVIDRVNTTSSVFMGLTLGCAQCHDHKYDPLSQREFYSFYAFFNNVKERDSDGFSGGNPRPTISVPNPDQAPRFADLEKRIADLEKRLEADDPLADADQKDWEARMRAHLGEPVAWTTFDPAGLISRNGSRLDELEDGSILAHGPTPVKDVYDVVLAPGKKRIAALKLEVLPDPAQPEGASGRASDGRFILSRLEIRNSTLSDSSDPPLVYITKAEADLNQKTDFESIDANFDSGNPGSIEGSIAVEAAKEGGDGEFGNFRGGGGWSIAGEARKEAHEAILLPIEPLETNDASVLRVTLHFLSSQKFKSLIGRFRLSYTEDDRIRTSMLPVAPKHWSTVGPFPAADVATAYSTAFAPEAELGTGIDRTRRYEKPVVAKADGAKGEDSNKAEGKNAAAAAKSGKSEGAGGDSKSKSEGARTPPATAEGGKPGGDVPRSPTPPPEGAGSSPAKEGEGTKTAKNRLTESKGDAPSPGDGAKAPESAAKQDSGEASPKKNGVLANAKPEDSKPADGKPGESKDEEKKKPEKLAWSERGTWKDGDRQRLEGENSAWYLTRKIVCTSPRTVSIRIDGGEGMKVWLNGEEVHAKAPVPKVETEKKSEGDDKENDFGSFVRSSEVDSRAKLKLGLRAGENELTVKVVVGAAPKNPSRGGAMGGAMGGGFGGGGGRGAAGGATFSFTLTPEGEDALTWEVAQALRAEFATTAASAAVGTAGVATGQDVVAGAESTETKSGPYAGETPRGATNASALSEKPAGDPSVEEKAEKLSKAAEARSVARKKVIRDFHRRKVSTVGRVLAEELDRLKTERAELKKQMPETMVMDEMSTPRKTHVFLRGHYKNKGDEVEPGTPGVLPPLASDAPRNRLGLANWLFSKEHPLTARVAVNRAWQQFFGVGIVKTAEDFGIRAELPSHPELLDYLALEFVDSGWDVKKLHSRIVLSATYRQAATIAPEKLEKDPENRLLARGPRLRLTAEMIRDHALATSGLLVERLGGKPVKPYQPEGLWSAITGGRDYKRDSDDGQYRRGLYVYWKRGVPYPSFITFDAAKRETCTVTRPYTTTPLQALVLLNDPVYVEAARMFGERMLKQGGKDDAKRLDFGFRLATSRAPSSSESAILVDLLRKQREHFSSDPEAVKKLLAIGDAKHDPKLDVVELAAWSQVASALLNLDATIRRG